MKTLDELGQYLEEVTGKSPALREMPQGKDRGVPLFLRSTYRAYSADLFGRRFAFAVEQDDPGGTTPLTRAKHVELLRTALGTDVALVLHGVPTHDRNRLVQRGVPFVVPGRQMYLPFLAMDLRERDHRLSRVNCKALSAAAQAVVLRRLLAKPVDDLTLADLAEAAGYSAMTMTNVGDELERLGLCAVAREGRTRRIVFDAQGAQLWERALPLLRDPVRATRWARKWNTRRGRKIVGGLSALSRYTSIAEDGVPVFALWHKDYRTQVEHGDIVGCEGPDEAEIAIECWTYDPARLADGDRVDRLSLYLALRTTSDERVEKELRVLLEGVEW